MKNKRPSKEQAIVRSTKFNTLLQAYNAYSKRDKEYEAEREKIAESIKRLERKESRLWKNIAKREDFLIAIGNQVMKKLGGTSVEILGPFGVNSEMSIWVWKGERDEELNNVIFSLTTISDFRIKVAQKSFRPDDIDYIFIEPNQEMTIDWSIAMHAKEKRLSNKVSKYRNQNQK